MVGLRCAGLARQRSCRTATGSLPRLLAAGVVGDMRPTAALYCLAIAGAWSGFVQLLK